MISHAISFTVVLVVNEVGCEVWDAVLPIVVSSDLNSVCARWNWRVVLVANALCRRLFLLALEVLGGRGRSAHNFKVDHSSLVKDKLPDARFIGFDVINCVALAAVSHELEEFAFGIIAVVLVANMVGFDQWCSCPFAILPDLVDCSIFVAVEVLAFDSVCARWHWSLARANAHAEYAYACFELCVFSFKAQLDARHWVNKLKLQDAFFVCFDASELVELVVHAVNVGKVAVGIAVTFHAVVASHAFMILTAVAV